MVVSHQSDEYSVNTFLDLQKDLAIWLKEAHDVDGEWTVAEKKRFLNKGLAAVATETLIVKKVINFEATGTTANPNKNLTVPDRVLKPILLIVGNNEHKEMDLDTYMRNVGLFMDVPTGGQTSTTSTETTVNFSNFFWWDEATNTFRINPGITEDTGISLYASVAPKLMINDGDVCDINPMWTHVAAAWAAMMMLPQDEEHRDRGLAAKLVYEEGIDKIERYKRKDAGSKSTKMIKDPEKFPRRARNRDGMRYDLGTSFDIGLP